MSSIVSEAAGNPHDIVDDRLDNLPFSLVCLDMDGTMLNDAHQISEQTASCLNMLSSLGVTIAIATGRSHASVIEYLQKSLVLCQEFVPVIAFNGSVCLLVSTSTWEITETVFKTDIDRESLDPLLKMCNDRTSTDEKDTVVLQYYDGNTGAVNVAKGVSESVEEKKLLQRYAELTGKDQIIVPSYESLADEQGILPVKCLALTPDVDRLIERAHKELPVDAFHVIRGSPFPFFVEFLRPGANKGTAVEKLVDWLQNNSLNSSNNSIAATSATIDTTIKRYSLDNTIAFGDGENDCEMLAVVGHGVAMLNGRPAAKSAAKDITSFTNDQNGVAKYLESVFFV